MSIPRIEGRVQWLRASYPRSPITALSDDWQEDSIDRQRSQVEPFALRNGFRIVATYFDEGIAGDEEEKRTGFMR